jgi:hypothetical protein
VSVAEVAPIAFALGVLVGLIGASAWRLVRRRDYDRWAARHRDE